MNDEIWSRDEVDSPCIKICVLHPVDRVCIGCYRTLDEIASWSAMSAFERARITADLPARRPAARRRGGRSGRLARED